MRPMMMWKPPGSVGMAMMRLPAVAVQASWDALGARRSVLPSDFAGGCDHGEGADHAEDCAQKAEHGGDLGEGGKEAHALAEFADFALAGFRRWLLLLKEARARLWDGTGREDDGGEVGLGSVGSAAARGRRAGLVAQGGEGLEQRARDDARLAREDEVLGRRSSWPGGSRGRCGDHEPAAAEDHVPDG